MFYTVTVQNACFIQFPFMTVANILYKYSPRDLCALFLKDKMITKKHNMFARNYTKANNGTRYCR